MRNKSNKLKLLFAGLLFFSYAMAAAAQDAKDREYIIGHGDILNISVWKDEALARQVTVLPDGRITYPLIGEIRAAGKTIPQLREELKSRLKRFIPNPTLNIEVAQINSMLIYVIGKVNHPGRFTMNTNCDVLQALAMAGGLNPFAESDHILIFRKTGRQTKTYRFNYDEVSEGNTLSQNILLERGDVIVVP